MKILNKIICIFIFLSLCVMSSNFNVKARAIETEVWKKTSQLDEYGTIVVKANVNYNATTGTYTLKKVYYTFTPSGQYPTSLISNFTYDKTVNTRISCNSVINTNVTVAVFGINSKTYKIKVTAATS